MTEEITLVSDRPQTSSGWHNYSDKAKQALGWLTGKSSDALQLADSALGTVSGKAALEKVAAYVQESEAVNTAMATRIYDLIDREDRLRKRVTAAEKTAKWLIGASIVYAASIGLILYLVLSRS
jgi:hypothetical protein